MFIRLANRRSVTLRLRKNLRGRYEITTRAGGKTTHAGLVNSRDLYIRTRGCNPLLVTAAYAGYNVTVIIDKRLKAQQSQKRFLLI